MGSKTRYFLIVLGVLVAGFTLSLFTSARVSADPVDSNRQPLLVEILNLPLAITGAVSVDNLPVDEASNSLRTTSPAVVLRDGFGQISTKGTVTRVDIPVGTALTDVIIRRVPVGTTPICHFELSYYSDEDNRDHRLLDLDVSWDDPIVELHFESGISSASDRQIGFSMVYPDCVANIFWTGYEY
jgi:hypothetical protein